MKGQGLTELRRSHAAGIHDTAPTRSAVKKQAILQDMEDSGMSEFDQDYISDDFDDFDEEPSDDELAAIEEEEKHEDYRSVDLDEEAYPHEAETQMDPYGVY